MKEILYLDNMLTPKIITFVYWLLIIGFVLTGLKAISDGNALMGLGMIVAGAVGSRVWCELLIVIFKINEAVQDIRDK